MDSEIIKKIRNGILDARTNFAGSDASFSKTLGINAAQYSRIQSGDVVQVLSDAKWYNIARMLNIQLQNRPDWNVAETPVFLYLMKQLESCQNNSVSLMLCDMADIGKSFTAKYYCKKNKNAVYIDCSQTKSKQRLVRAIARQFGVDSGGKYIDVYEDLIFFLICQQIPPIIVLDEAGDLEYAAFLELKALWNATEGTCAWFMMGADGLKEKIRRSIDCKKVGFTELFSRYGIRYQRATPEAAEDRDRFNTAQAALIIKANAPEGGDVNKVIAKTNGSLRRIYIELTKIAG